MIRRTAASAALVCLCLAGCDDRSKAEQAPVEAAAAAPREKTAPAVTDAPATPEPAVAVPAAPGAPAYAALYPGAALDQPATTAAGPDGEGGLVTFTTAATPDDVVAFYRTRAEEAGLTSVMGMNQGDARAYGAAGGQAGSANLQVVAAPGEGGATSVQLSWSAGL
ncbi:hypothetical protein [Brevundimonas sp. SL130]|uniref:hypothetical protein n=1 Tax=Brevundimonas sp. SL130 TaxID=2995143 RepID=UPI00226CDF73|nr:hypothetical protein [Brevundimonas sp. SL130]WAC60365.1 hypothetical protein OU998_02650 [Brevundimonas sp. SL130]